MKASGRNLSDFEPLDADEKRLLDCCREGRRFCSDPACSQRQAGKECQHNAEEAGSRPAKVRSGFVRFLCLGGDDNAPVHEAGVAMCGATLDGDLNLASCEIPARVEIRNSLISGDVRLADAHAPHISLEGTRIRTLWGDGLRVDVGLFLRNGFEAEKGVRLIGAQIGGKLDLRDGSFCKGDDFAINAEFLTAKDGLVFTDVRKIGGDINFSRATFGALSDDLSSWEKAGNIDIDGMTYGHLLDKKHQWMAKEHRIAWLDKQTEFKSHPWWQLIRTLRAMGNNEDADEIAIELNRRLAKNKRGRSQVLSIAFGYLAAYGYKPFRIVGLMILFWLACAFLYGYAASDGLFAPTNPLIFESKLYEVCRPQNRNKKYNPQENGLEANSGNWTACALLPPEYTTFSPLLFSLDVLLPVVDLQQEKDWAPITSRDPGPDDYRLESFFKWSGGHWIRLLIVVQTLFGWIATLLLGAVLAGTFNKEKEN